MTYPPNRLQFLTVLALGAAFIVAAFWAAGITGPTGTMSLTPPPTEADPNPAQDVTNPVALHAAAYTAWAALVLLIPALIAYPFRKTPTWGPMWFSFWLTACIAYVTHILYAMGGFYGWDFEAMRSSSRVSAFWPAVVLLFWWPIDCALVWYGRRRKWASMQRAVLAFVLFFLFVGGSLVKGELITVRALGFLLFAGATAAFAVRMKRQFER